MSFAHLTLATRDVDRSVHFFEKAMGWMSIKAPANAPAMLSAAWIEIAPGQQLHILRIEGFEPSPFEDEFGRHFAVFHPVADFANAKQRILAEGGRLLDPLRETPFERFYFKDPNGYMFEVIAQEQYQTE